MAKNNIDKSNMKEVIVKSPDQFAEGLDLAKNIKIKGNFENVVICAMGGSAWHADILTSLVLPSIPIYMHRDYNLPAIASKNSLIICISYSGNTEETISALEEAVKKEFKIAIIASGGRLEEISRKNNIPLAKIPSGIQPRSATGYLFSSLSMILTNCGIIDDISDDVNDTAKNLAKINSTLEKEGKNLAKKLIKKIPIVYASNNFKEIARIWKIKFNENSKIPSFHNYFPELNHNEMVGFTNVNKGSNFHVLIIEDKDDHKRTVKRMRLMSSILKKKNIKTDFIQTKSGSLMFRMFSNLLLGDWTSYYLALNHEIDPTPVAMVEEFKKMMQK